MSATAHRNKRPFQPSITSYFARVDRSEHDETSSPSRADAPQQGNHALPANIQASLLNVGMRVRKSVPEGYKTHKTMAPPTASTLSASMRQTVDYAPAAAAAGGRPNELLPFCGIHKTGGYSVQQQPAPAVYASVAMPSHPVDAHAIRFSADDFALSSQESNASTLSTDSLAAASSAQKRRFEEEDEEDGSAMMLNAKPLFPSLNTSLAVPASAYDDDLQISPRTVYPVSHTAMPSLDAQSLRPVARPKSRRKNGAPVGFSSAASARQANGDGFDFGEADFLRPPSQWSEDGEVEMGGV